MPNYTKNAAANLPTATASNYPNNDTPVPYLFRGHEVRMLIGNDGQPRWIAADVAKILGYRSAPDMTRNLRDRHAGKRIVRARSANGVEQDREMLVITEAGLYAAVLKSRRPDAEAFQDWVTDEVLPSLRKTGAYGQPAAASEDEVLRDAFGILDRRVAALAAEKAALTPKAEAYDAFLDAGDALPMNAVAKALGIGANSLFAQLRDKKVLINGGARHNLPMQRYAHHFKVVAVEYVKPNGTRACSYTTKVRPSGVNFIRHTLDLPGTPGDLARPTSQSH